MKQTYSILVSLILLLAACQAALPSPTPATNTAAPIAQTTQTATLASATTTQTSTPVLPAATSTPSHTPLSTYTFIPTLPPPTRTPTVTPTILSTSTIPPLSPPPGYIVMFWSPEPEDIYEPLPVNMYFLKPQNTAAEWIIQPMLTELVGVSGALSPDRMKLALSYFEDTDQNGQVSFQAGPDLSNVHLYSLGDNSLTQLTDNQIKEWPDVSWLPDSQGFTYALYKDIVQVNLGDSNPQLLLSMPGFVYYHAWSPNGRWLAVFSAMSDEPTQSSQAARLDIYDRETGSLINIAESIGQGILSWSPNSQFLVFNQESSSGLFLVNTNDFGLLELLSRDYLTLFSWSPDGYHLAFTQTQQNDRTNSTFVLWNTSDFSTKELVVNNGRLGEPTWSPDGNAITTTRFNPDNENSIDLLLIKPTDGNTSVIFTSELPEIIIENMSILETLLRTSWSPDSQWLILVAVREGIAGLYLLDQVSGEAYLVQDITGTHAPVILGWLP